MRPDNYFQAAGESFHQAVVNGQVPDLRCSLMHDYIITSYGIQLLGGGALLFAAPFIVLCCAPEIPWPNIFIIFAVCHPLGVISMKTGYRMLRER